MKNQDQQSTEAYRVNGHATNGHATNGDTIKEYLDVHRAGMRVPGMIVKRDGRIVSFDIGRIEHAMTRCFANMGRTPHTPVPDLARHVVNIFSAKANGNIPTVEEVQDIVEMVLQAAGEFEAAKNYILYRAEHARKREERPIPDEVRSAFAESDKYFPTPLQKFQFFDKYARFSYLLGRRETWIETVDRAVDFFYELAGSRLPSETYERLRRAILEMRVMPSMRLLAMAGPAARRSHITIYNCSYQPVESIDSFVEGLIISMSGCGVGFSVESRYVENFPRIKRQTGLVADPFVVPDSAEGWADALRLGLEAWFEGADISFDFSLIRPSGTPLRTKGGRASGPEPLRRMLKFTRSRILARQGSFLRPIDAHDIMCAVGSAAVSGGVRRTAMISLFDYDDAELQQSKGGDFERENSQRWNANNSAVWPEGGFTQMEFINKFVEMVESGRGEPGIFSREAATAMRPARRQPAEYGTNPCVTGNTWVLTTHGPQQVRHLVGVQHTTLVDGTPYETTAQGFWETGVKPVLRLRTREGYTLRLTANHPVLAVSSLSHKDEETTWTEAGLLKPGDMIKLHNHRGSEWEGDGTWDEGWLLGSLVGGGTFAANTAQLVFWGEQRSQMVEQAIGKIGSCLSAHSDVHGQNQAEYNCTNVQSVGLRDLAADYGIYRGVRTITRFVEQTSQPFHCGFLQGLFDAEGAVIGTPAKGVSVRLAHSDLGLLQAAQRMLVRLGIVATISPIAPSHPDRRGAGSHIPTDDASADYELIIANDNLGTFAATVNFSDPEKRTRLAQKLAAYTHLPPGERFVATVASIEPDGAEMVYDCTVPDKQAFDANGLYVHNCGEIILPPWSFCNLSSAIARVDDTFDTLRDKVEIATIIGSIQSMATYFPGLRPMWSENCQRERLLGVDITGQMDSPAVQDAQVKAQLRQIAVETNQQTAHMLGINQSAAVTCVKPSGNSSQFVDCSSGLHARWAPYYIRNVRVAAHSPMFKVLRDAGVPMDPENGQTPEDANTWVVHFPVKAPDGAITRTDRSAIEQCEYWLQNKLYWTEHNPSCTITYRPDEVIDLMKWVWEHRDQLGGITFLPAFDAHYDQMPYVEISKEQYEKLAAVFPDIDFSKIYRYEDRDLTNVAQEMACFSGSCEIDL